MQELLRNAYFFRNLADDAVAAIAAVCHTVSCDAGTIVFREGDEGDGLYFVVRGTVEVWKHYGESDARLLGRHETGHAVGEMALVDELPRSATAIASTETSLLFLRRSDFATLVHTYPDLAMSVMRSLSAIVRTSNDSFVADLHYRNRELERAYQALEEAQQEALRNERLSNLGKMANMILHDIRNPVAVLTGYAEMLERLADDPDRVREFATRVRTEAARLGHLSGELLDYARGEIRLDLSVVKPSEVAEAAAGYVRSACASAGVALAVNVSNDRPIVVDRPRLIRTVVNLLENALRASHSGGTISVEVEQRDARCTISVADTGDGMDEATVARIFEPFFSGARSGGTGLGMVIVESIVRAHGGELDVSTALGAGTTIWISLPVSGPLKQTRQVSAGEL
jgi:signal transduction histidine kinase